MKPSFRFSTVAFMLATLLAVAQFALPARAAVTFNGSESVDGVIIPHPITGEGIVLSGSFHIVIKDVSNAGGGHADVSVNFQGVSGLGLPSGTEYSISNNSQQHSFVADDFYPNVFHFTDDRRFISHGSEENVIVRTRWIVVVNANGTQSVFIDTMETLIVG